MTKKEKLQKLKDSMQRDMALPLRKGATQLVFGEGDPETEIMFIGEGPGYWEDQGIKDLNGTVWYRKVIDVPASMIGKAGRVFLGRIVDADAFYINGKQIGNTLKDVTRFHQMF